MRTFDTLQGGSVARLARMRHYRDDWNRKADSGERRYAMRSKLSDGLEGALQARSHGVGEWKSDAHGIGDQLQRARQERKGYVSAPWGLVDGWRDIGDSGDIIRLRYTGWYADAHESEIYRGHVWQLPARDGTPRYVAGYVEDQGGDDGTRAGGYVVLECDRGALVMYDEKEDAARAGDALAERMAEDAREYDERWQEARRHDDERDDARGELKRAALDAREAIDALREQQATQVNTPENTCTLIRRQYESARGRMRAALRTIAEASKNIHSLGMNGEF